MKVVEIPRHGPPEVLTLRERPAPTPCDGEVVIDVRAAGVNFADLMGRMGLYPDAPPYPYVPGYEIAGVEVNSGRRVIAATRFGGYAGQVRVPITHAMDLPEALTFEEGAAIPVNYLTAWVALMELARVREGERVVIHSGAGGVGIAAIQILLHHGARAVGVVGTREKADFIRGLGAEAVVRPEPPPKADVILDPRGPGTLKEALRSLNRGGRVVVFGAQTLVTGSKRKLLSAAWKMITRPKIDPIALMNSNKGIFGLNMLHVPAESPMIQQGLKAILNGVREGWVKPKIAKVFPLERAAEAHAYLHERRNIGKVVLTP